MRTNKFIVYTTADQVDFFLLTVPMQFFCGGLFMLLFVTIWKKSHRSQWTEHLNAAEEMGDGNDGQRVFSIMRSPVPAPDEAIHADSKAEVNKNTGTLAESEEAVYENLRFRSHPEDLSAARINTLPKRSNINHFKRIESEINPNGPAPDVVYSTIPKRVAKKHATVSRRESTDTVDSDNDAGRQQKAAYRQELRKSSLIHVSDTNSIPVLEGLRKWASYRRISKENEDAAPGEKIYESPNLNPWGTYRRARKSDSQLPELQDRSSISPRPHTLVSPLESFNWEDVEVPEQHVPPRKPPPRKPALKKKTRPVLTNPISILKNDLKSETVSVPIENEPSWIKKQFEHLKRTKDRTESSEPNNQNRANVGSDEKAPFIYCRLITAYPKTSFVLTLCGHLLIMVITVVLLLSQYNLFPTDFENLPMYDWDVPWRRRDMAWKFRDEYENKYVRKLFRQSLPKWYRYTEYPRGNMMLFYDAGNENIFTKQNFQRMEYIENTVISIPDYTKYCVQDSNGRCQMPTSILRYFDGTYANINPVFYDPNYNRIPAVIFSALNDNRTKEKFSVLLAKENSISPQYAHATLTRTIIPMGYPLRDYTVSDHKDNKLMEAEMQKFLVNSFKPLILRLKSETKQFDVVYWSYLLFVKDIAKQALWDMLLALGSLVFIFCFIVFHTKSLWISLFAILSIASSFLAANMIYRIVLDFRYFGLFHIIAIFIILGIGADDLFIFLDVWKNTAFTTYPSVAHRLSDAYKRSVISMFITSLTTVIAFFASAFSPLLPAKSFGIFAGLLVIVNYISVVIFFPTVVIMHHVYFEQFKWPCLSCCSMCKGRSNDHETKSLPDGTTSSCGGPLSCTRKSGSIDGLDGKSNKAFELEKEIEYGFLPTDQDDGPLAYMFIDDLHRPEVDTVKNQNKFTCDAVTYTDIITTENEAKQTDRDKKRLVRFFRDYFYRLVTHRIVRWIIVIILLLVVIGLAYFAVNLELDNEQVTARYEQQSPWRACVTAQSPGAFLSVLAVGLAGGTVRTLTRFQQVKYYRGSHNYGKALEFDSKGFVLSGSDRDVSVYIVWGLHPRDMSVCHFSDQYCLGVQRYDDSFDPNSPQAQKALINFCDTLVNMAPDEIEAFRIRRDIVTGHPEIRCLTKELRDFLWKESLATGVDWSLPWDYTKTMTFMWNRPVLYDTAKFNQTFGNLLQVPISYWLNDGYRFWNVSDFQSYHSLIGEAGSPYSTPLKTDFTVFYGNKIKYIAVEVNLTLGRFSTGYKTGKPVMDRWENFVSSQMQQMPQGLQNGFQLTRSLWHNLSIQKTMADSALFGIVLGILCALPILILATRNLIIGFFATFSMCCTTVCVIGVISLAGWKLGLLESLNMCMVVGLSVDYVVHLAEGYHMSAHTDRMLRLRDMLEEVGISVFSGACTTLGASIFMLFAQIQFLVKFGIFMFCTIGFSLIFSLVFFTTVMGILGPSGKTGDIGVLFQKLCSLRKKKTESDPVRNVTQTQSSIEEADSGNL